MTPIEDIFGLQGPNRTIYESAPDAGADRGLASGGALPQGTPGHGPLVQAGFGLLALAPRLSARRPPGDPAALRRTVERELTRFADRLGQRGIDQRLIQFGHYSLCALLDDVVLNTPWGAEGVWRNDSLAGTLHRDVAAGEHFFTYLDQARRAPDRTRPLLELMAACLALGFEGRYRLGRAGGGEALRRIRTDLAAQLSGMAGDASPDLSGHWQGIPLPHRGMAGRVPLWVFGAGALVLLLLVYAGLELSLAASGTRLDALLAAMPPAGPVEIVRTAPAAPRPIPLAQPLAPALRACLGSGAAADAVAEDANRVRIRLPGGELFGSGQADLRSDMAPVITCLGRVLAGAPGRVLVLGYTDSIPIRTLAFPDNWALSRARAEAVAAMLRPALPQPDRVGVVARASNDPIAPNTDPAGRALNRRVEIVVEE
jgi:type VI secretion system protein ImpK